MKPHASYILQVQIYMFLTGVHNGMLLYQNKNTHQQAEYTFRFSPEIFDKVKHKITYIKNCIKSNKPPKRESEQNSQDCRWCKYFNTKQYCYEYDYNMFHNFFIVLMIRSSVIALDKAESDFLRA